MSQNTTHFNLAPFVWTMPREKAAVLVAADEMNDEQIAAEVGIARRTLTMWKTHPVFAARVAAHVAAFREAVLSHGIADRVKRVARLNADWEALQTILRERAIYYDGEAKDALSEGKITSANSPALHPGMTTGRLVHRIVGVGKGDDFRLVDVFETDTGTLGELRALEMQAAKETGQWVEKSQHAYDPSQPLVVKRISGVSMDDL